MLVEIGKKAPAFHLESSEGTKVRLSTHSGEWVVLFFYPKDMTPGCTTEACDFRDHKSKFKRKGAHIYGVSKDSMERHEKFRDKYELNFPLLSDEEGSVLEKYGVWQEKNFYGKKSMGIVRTTYIIDPKGKIARVYPKVKVKEHVQQVLQDLADLQKDYQ